MSEAARRITADLRHAETAVPVTPGCRRSTLSDMQTGDTVQIVIHVWRSKLAYHVIISPKRGRRYIGARGVAEREIEPTHDTYGRAVMDAAYEAYRDLGE